MKTFEELGLSQDTLKVLKQKGFEEPTPIQEKTIPALLAGKKDLLGQAQTGTGKTAAFGLPILELINEKARAVQALILAPTRELAIQVAQELNSLKGKRRLNVVPIYGGQSIELQLRQLKKGVDIVVGTPGRVLDHIKRRTLKLGDISFMVLDEADEMLNMGFLEDVQTIMKQTPPKKRTMLFSATMPQAIMNIAKKHMGEFDIMKVSPGQLTVSATEQIYFEVAASDKFEALCRIIDIEEAFYGLVFCRTKVDVDKVSALLVERGYDADALHGDISQSGREKILARFKKKRVNVLIATDVAARGIDIADLTHVINYSLPQDPEAYVHRIGRTGRAGKEGIAITFITPSEYRKLQAIKHAAKTNIKKAQLPKVKDLIKTKKNRIKMRLENIMAGKARRECVEMADELLEKNAAGEVLAALLEHYFGAELDEKSYAEIESRPVDLKGKTRLFVGQGRADGLNRKKLVDFITEKCNIDGNKIRDISILDKFSFISLPFFEAEIVLDSFRNRRKGRGVLITKAKQTKEDSRKGSPSRKRGRKK